MIPLALALGTVILVSARLRALRRSPGLGVDGVRPLTPVELVRLHRWASRLRRVLVLVGFAYLALFAAWWLRDLLPLLDPQVTLALFALVGIAGVAAQFSERCPRCGYNLGFQARLDLPERCERCGGPYR